MNSSFTLSVTTGPKVVRLARTRHLGKREDCCCCSSGFRCRKRRLDNVGNALVKNVCHSEVPMTLQPSQGWLRLVATSLARGFGISIGFNTWRDLIKLCHRESGLLKTRCGSRTLSQGLALECAPKRPLQKCLFPLESRFSITPQVRTSVRVHGTEKPFSSFWGCAVLGCLCACTTCLLWQLIWECFGAWVISQSDPKLCATKHTLAPQHQIGFQISDLAAIS